MGIILFRHQKEELFREFIEDALGKIRVLSLPENLYSQLVIFKQKYGLDFDDAYQLGFSSHHGMKLVTMDQDFRTTGEENIFFL